MHAKEETKHDSHDHAAPHAAYTCTSCGSVAEGNPGVCCGVERAENCKACGHRHPRGSACECDCK